jgi:hypothetical protein
MVYTRVTRGELCRENSENWCVETMGTFFGDTDGFALANIITLSMGK